MKKNFMMRAASVLLVAVMLTTCAISGTFAKYVTSDGAGDTARVAKFGVVVAASGTLFDKTYLTTANTPGGATSDGEGAVLSVESSNSDNLVAPGTKNEDGITFSITGKPEVDVSVSVELGALDEYVFLSAGEYKDMTTGDDDTFTFGPENYEPVRFTLTQAKYDAEGNKLAATEILTDGTFADLQTKLNAIVDTHVDANTDLGTVYGEYVLTWEWIYGSTANDKVDTVLGALAAGNYPVSLADGTDYNLDEKVNFTITVTQID